MQVATAKVQEDKAARREKLLFCGTKRGGTTLFLRPVFFCGTTSNRVLFMLAPGSRRQIVVCITVVENPYDIQKLHLGLAGREASVGVEASS